MNIFVLDSSFHKNAEYHVDRHIVKMPLESAQLLCTARRYYNDATAPYQSTHINHPCSIFTRSSRDAYIWVCRYGLALCKEYTYRYGKKHKCENIIYDSMKYEFLFREEPLWNFPLCMPDYCKIGNTIDSYREYYRQEKQHLFTWKKRERPDWL